MEHYRIYPIGVHGVIVSGTSFECDTDEEAMREAAGLIGANPVIEVWCGTRRVCRFTADEVARYRRS